MWMFFSGWYYSLASVKKIRLLDTSIELYYIGEEQATIIYNVTEKEKEKLKTFLNGRNN